MITKRENWPHQADDKTKLVFRKITNLSAIPENFYEWPWDQLHETRSKTKKSLDRILGISEDEKRDFTDDEKIAFDHGTLILDALNEEMEIRSERGTKNPVDLSNKMSQVFQDNGVSKKKNSNSRKYQDVFSKSEHEVRDTGGFDSFGDFIQIVSSGRTDSRLEKRTWSETGGAVGGFAVPVGFYEQIWNTVIEESVVLGRAQAFPMGHGNLVIPAFQNQDRNTDGLYGGMVPQWLGEAQTATEVTGKLRTVTLQAHKLALYTNMSLEVINDSIALEDAVTQALTKSISFYADYYLLRGNGVAKPSGVLIDPALIKIARNTVNDVKFIDIVSMYSRLYGPCVKNAVWVISPTVVPQLIQMVDTGNHLIWTPSPVYGGAISGPVPNSLFGLPVIVSEKLPALGTEGDMLLADFSNYAFGTAQTILFERSNAPGWHEGTISYRGIIRLDGAGLWEKPLTGLSGGNTLSWCVCLS
ncbi:MAG: phage major capsid protein [Thermodesulfovibrionales bacterium]